MLFQPNRAEYNLHDPAIAHLRSIASHNGFGELVLVHGVPLHSLYPGDAIEMARVAAAGGRRETRVLQTNLKVIAEEVRGADAVLLGWGARARKCSAWFDQVLHTVRTNLDAKLRSTALRRPPMDFR